jgi:hypothetical protein
MRLLLYFGFEVFEGNAPEAVEIRSEIGESGQVDLVETARPDGAVADEMSILEHTQVLRDRGAADGKAGGEIAHRARPSAQAIKESAAVEIAKSIESRMVSLH